MGKTSLLRDAADQATGLRVLRARGIESESHLPFAALSELLAPLLDLRSEIPPVQARALGGALALEATPVTDRFAVAAGGAEPARRGRRAPAGARARRRPAVARRGLARGAAVRRPAARRRGGVLLFGLRDGEGMEAARSASTRCALTGLDERAPHRCWPPRPTGWRHR